MDTSTEQHYRPKGSMMSVKCFHVSTDKGHTYGAAATGKREAMSMVQDRLTGEGHGDRPVSAVSVGSWPGVDYGTVLWYS